MKIEEIDSNFKSAELNGKLYNFFDIHDEPFEINGFPWRKKSEKFCRLPEKLLSDESINLGARQLAWHTSGGMVRFKTNSPSLAVKVKTSFKTNMSHMPRSGSSGFDVYAGTGKNKKFIDALIPAVNANIIEKNIELGHSGVTKELTINFPLYDGTEEVMIGVEPGNSISAPTPFTIQRPVLFYGSSITQGGCASRPGNAFSHLLGRWLDAPIINLGFSGSGRGETAVAEAIATLELSAFVMDYDHNAATPEYLKKTHEIFFRIIREKHPGLPVIFVTRCDCDKGPEDEVKQRMKIIKDTYNNAILAGDTKVSFIDGKILFGKKDRDACTVDGCHPNDVGFMRMAEHIYPVLSKALGISE